MIGIIVGAVLAVVAIVVAVLFFTGVLGDDDDDSSDASEDKTSSEHDKSSDGKDEDDQDEKEQEPAEGDSDWDDEPSDQDGDSAEGDPQDAVRQYLEAQEERDCDKRDDVMAVPEQFEGSEDRFRKDMCKGLEQSEDLDIPGAPDASELPLETLEDNGHEAKVEVGEGVAYTLTCVAVDGEWKVDPLSGELGDGQEGDGGLGQEGEGGLGQGEQSA